MSYVVLDNEVLKVKGLQAIDWGVIWFMATFAPDWQFHQDHLCKAMKIGIYRLKAILKRLKAAGIVTTITVREQGIITNRYYRFNRDEVLYRNNNS